MTPNPPESSGSRWSDLSRPPLNAVSLRRALISADSLWTSLDVVDSTGSTNSDLTDRARDGSAEEGAVLVAEEQTAGRGRLDRGWSAPPRSGVFVSVLLEPQVPQERWGWLPLLAGVATASALARAAGVDTRLKWPNDVLVDIEGEERKIGGILAERTAVPSRGAQGRADAGVGGDAAVVLGIGLNVSLRSSELPVPTAGSLVLAGAQGTDRDPLLRAVLRSVEDWYGRWSAADGDPLGSGVLEAYAAGCSTLGRTVRAELPGGEELVGEAVAVDSDGRLVIGTESGVQRPVAAGDIVHLRGHGGAGA